MIYLWATMLGTAVVVGILFPAFWSRNAIMSRADSARDMLYDQLEEVTREVSDGLISPSDGDALRVEIKRRLIAVDRQFLSRTTLNTSGGWVLFVAAILVPVAAIPVYLTVGAPEMPSAVFAERSEERSAIFARSEETRRLVDELEAAADGGSFDGWVQAAEKYLAARSYAQAADAYGRILDREQVTSNEFVRYAEALILSENGTVTPAAKSALERSLELDPGNPAAVFYTSFALDQAGQVDAAYALLVARLKAANGKHAWMEAFVARANHYGKKLGRSGISLSDFTYDAPGPTKETISQVAKMSPEERSAFITSMVVGLAERLESDPDDLDGWLMLGRAYSVLGEQKLALEAYRQAQRLTEDMPVDDRRKQLVQEKLMELQ